MFDSRKLINKIIKDKSKNNFPFPDMDKVVPLQNPLKEEMRPEREKFNTYMRERRRRMGGQ